MSFVALVVMASSALFAQQPDSIPAAYQAVQENNIVPEMVEILNPTKQALDIFLPDTIGSYVCKVGINENVGQDLTGCFKTYHVNGSTQQNLSINISRGNLGLVKALSFGSISEKATSIAGYNGKLIVNTNTSTYTWKLQVSDKLVVFSFQSIENETIGETFLQKLNFALISNL